MPHRAKPKQKNHSAQQFSALIFLALASCALMFSGFFFGSSDFIHSYTTAKLWDFGHFVFFFLASLLILHFGPQPLWYRGFIKTSLIALFAGLMIEALQSVVGRQASLKDIGFDLLGAGCASLWRYRQQNHKGKKTLWALYSALLLLATTPLLLGMSNSLLAHWQKPVLLSFDYALEKMRLSGNATISFQQYQGRAGAKIRFGDQQYSGFKLTETSTDWRQQHQLIIELNNLQETALSLSCRIHDIHHNQAYNDRFNHTWLLHPGQQQLVITLSDIINAPQHRPLDIAQITELGCFTIKASDHPTIFLQRIYLR